MKNFLKVSPEEWKKEREIGQTSFIIKRTVIFTILSMPVCMLINYLLISEKEVFSIGATILLTVLMSVFFSVNEWAGLEYNHRQEIRKKAGRT